MDQWHGRVLAPMNWLHRTMRRTTGHSIWRILLRRDKLRLSKTLMVINTSSELII